MNIDVSRKWYAGGVREFGQPAQRISEGAYHFVQLMLEAIANQKGNKHTAPLDCEALLVEMQTGLNRLSNPHLLFTVPGTTSASSSALPSEPGLTVCTSVAVPPPPPPHPARKRQSQDDNDNPQKRRREMSPDLFDCSSSVEPDSPIPGPVHRPRPRPVRSRKLIDIDQTNCVQNRTRAARTPTELYQEPEKANWGRNGITQCAVMRGTDALNPSSY